MKIKNMIMAINNRIKNESIIQTGDSDEIFYDFTEYDKNIKIEIVWESKIDERRWYGLQWLVYKLTFEDEIVYVKTWVVTQSYSEMQSIDDISHKYPEFKFMKPKEVTSIEYEEIKYED